MMSTKIYDAAVKYIGMKEIPGPEDNPEIVKMFADTGNEWVKDDETAWCAAFVGAILERNGVKSTKSLAARSYEKWGTAVPIEEALPGDICVFWRGSPKAATGHVAFYDHHDANSVWVLGGNQGNQVSIAKYPRTRLLSIRRAPISAAPAVKQPFRVSTQPADHVPATDEKSVVTIDVNLEAARAPSMGRKAAGFAAVMAIGAALGQFWADVSAWLHSIVPAVF